MNAGSETPPGAAVGSCCIRVYASSTHYAGMVPSRQTYRPMRAGTIAVISTLAFQVSDFCGNGVKQCRIKSYVIIGVPIGG